MLSKTGALLMAVLVTMALGASAASARSSKASSPIQEGNVSCGSNEESAPVIGTVKFKRTGNLVKFSVSLKKGQPNTVYGVDIAGNECTDLGRPVEFETNKRGVGHAKGSIEVPAEDTEFFADVDIFGFGAPGNDTPYVSLPAPA